MSPKKTKAVKKRMVVAKKAPAKKVEKCKCVKMPAITKPLGKSQMVKVMADMTCLSKKDVVGVMDALMEILSAHLKKRGPGEFTLPGVAKFRVINKPATKARQGVNPFTGETMTFAAKPARNVVKVRPLKKLKDLAK